MATSPSPATSPPAPSPSLASSPPPADSPSPPSSPPPACSSPLASSPLPAPSPPPLLPPQLLSAATPSAEAPVPQPIPLSPSLRIAPGGLHVQGGGGQMANKRKSPLATMQLFRSPVSRMFLSPKIPLPGARLGSPSVTHRTSPRSSLHDIDLNVAPENNEKWFYITQKTERYYTIGGEEEPVRTCKNKNYIPKIQILTAVAWPRFGTDGVCTFDGKIGCFPFVTYEPAKRSSVNRPAGTIEMKPISSINKGVMRDFLTGKVLPAIRAKWPREDANKPIFIQQDNAKPHIAPNDILFCEAAKQDGFDIRLVFQPPNSPDFNILDLGFFSSLQSIQYKQSAKTTEELLAAVYQAFESYSPCQLNKIFLTLHGCMKEVMKIGGGNGYSMPHIRKEMFERQGSLPLQLKCTASLVDEATTKSNE